MTNVNMTNSGTTDDPAEIERDIRRTQDDMSRTVDKLGDQLTMKNLFNALLDKADQNGVDANYLVDGARRNPIALGLIAAGAIWLVSDKDSEFPSVRGKSKARGADEFDRDGRDVHHSEYVSHMSALQMRDGEDPLAYQRRRDLHRASFLVCERNPEEDDASFRQRLDGLSEQFRQKRRAWSGSVGQAGASTAQSAQQAADSARRGARQAAERAQDLYDSNPLVGGILAAALGAALGSTVPISRKERETLGDLGAEARNMVSEQKDELASKAMEKKDELLEQADEKLQPSSGSEQGRQRQPAMQGGSSQVGESAGSDAPFIISERTQ
jgi:hypothetical protein